MKFQNSIYSGSETGNSTPPQSVNQVPVVATKGMRHRTEEINQIKNELNLLKPYARTKIKELPEDLRIKYNHLRSAFLLLEDTNLYEQVYNVAQEVFQCSTVQPVDLEPGIVLTAICGCLQSSRDSCSLYCAEAVKPPSSHGGSNCQDNVFVANTSGQQLELEQITTNPNSDRAIIYVQYNNIAYFPGFSVGEIEIIRSKNIKRVKLAGFPQRNLDSFISPNFIPLASLPMRKEPELNNTDNDQLTDGSGITIAVFIIVILLIIAIIWILYNYGRK